MRKFYVILTLGDYDEISQTVVAWTENPYIAISYFKEYRSMDEDATMVIYGCESHLELMRVLTEEYHIEMIDVLNLHLMTMTSKNERCYVIYKEEFSELFSDKFIKKHSEFICDNICRTMLSTIPLMKFINPQYNEVISNLLFIVYTYTSIKKMLRTGVKVDLTESIDIVYFWKYMMDTHPNQLVTADSGMLNPTAVVFIDSEYNKGRIL